MRRAASLLLALALSARVSAAPPRWHELAARADYGAAEYVADFGRTYASAEESALRAALITKRLAAIRAHNAGDAPYKMGVNQFTDRTDAELARLRGVPSARLAPRAAPPAPPRKASAAAPPALPASVDWRTKGVLTAVKNQGGCGSCWAFAATEAVESAFALATGRLEVLSEQQVLDCTPNPLECGGDGGCAGGTPELAFARMAQLGGLASEWEYPYVSFNGGNVGECRAAGGNATGGAPPLAHVTGFVQLPSNEAEPVLRALAEHGPLAVNVDASAWFQYEEGVFTGCAKATSDIDHAVLLVGYGTDAASGLDYYLVRNSWSTKWGEGGFIRLARQQKPACASDVTPFDGSDCRDVPDPVQTVTVCGECGILYDVSYPLVQEPAQL